MLSVTIATLFDIVGLIVLTVRGYNNREASLLQRDDCHLDLCEIIPEIAIITKSCTLKLLWDRLVHISKGGYDG